MKWLQPLLLNLARGSKPALFLAWCLLVAFFALTMANNFSETDDVFAFAFRAENFPLDHISDPRLMLYHMAMRSIYLVVSTIDPQVSALALMRTFSLLCAPVCLLLLLRIMHREFGMDAVSAVLTTALLAVTYGFWRYAVEADVYIPAIAWILLVFSYLLRLQRSRERQFGATIFAGLLGGLGVLFYQPSAIPLFFVFPLMLMFRSGVGSAFLYGIVGTIVVVAGYVAGYLYAMDLPLNRNNLIYFLSQRSGEFMVPALSLGVVVKSIIKSGFALSHDLLSASWVFGSEMLSALVHRIFPSNVTEEEIYAARSVGQLIYLPFITIPMILAGLFTLWRRIPEIPWRVWKSWQAMVLLVWLLLNAAVIGRLNPAGIEAWLMVLVPLVGLVGLLVIRPAVEAGETRLIAALLTLVLVHNWFAGMLIVRDSDSDYDYVKGEWVIEQALENDLVIVVDDAGFAELMRYRSKAEVVLVSSLSTPTLARMLLSGRPGDIPVYTRGRDFAGLPLFSYIEEVRRTSGFVFLFEDFVTWNTEYRRYYGEPNEQAKALFDRMIAERARETQEGVIGRSFRMSVARPAKSDFSSERAGRTSRLPQVE
ncbi:MAG: hypothetical protein AB8B81_08415 [Halioglobus sp.]